MKVRPLISVITIFYNPVPHFFEEAIASVLAQSETRWELLLVDDGSTNAGADLARRAAAEHPDRIRVLTHLDGGNHGMSASRNLGVHAAAGQYVCFLDADDLYLPQKLERQLAIFQEHPEVAIVFGPSLHWWSWSGQPQDGVADAERRLGASPGSVVRPPHLVREYLGRRADTPATCAVLIRRSAVLASGGFEPQFVDLYEDQAFFYKLLLTSSAYVEGTAWDRYRRHAAATCEVRIRSGDHSDDYFPTTPRRLFLEWLESYLARSPAADNELKRLLRRELFPYRHPRLQGLVDSLWAVGRRSPQWMRRTARRLLRT